MNRLFRHAAHRGTARHMSIVMGVVSLGLLSACGTIDDDTHGELTRKLLASQRIDPSATVRNAQELGVVEGRTVREAMDRQVDSFKAPPPSIILNVGVPSK